MSTIHSVKQDLALPLKKLINTETVNNKLLNTLLTIILFAFLPVHKTKQVGANEISASITKNMVKIPEGTFIPFYKKKGETKITVKPFYMDNNPVTNISWFAANAYCKWVGKRMPTTAEWEYAASADIADRKKNNKITILQIILDWYDKPTQAIIPVVGSTFKNKFGLYDMHGLIWEWVYDFNNYVTSGDSRSSSAVERDQYCGAGSANASANKEDYAAFMRYGFRGSLKGSYTVANLGFRCAMDIPKNRK